MNDLGHWKYNGPEVDISKMVGFIYIIKRLYPTPKYYIGKKLLENKKKRKPLKGRVNARHYKVDSDWKTYRSSSPLLQEEIEKLGEENFDFEILSFQPSKLLMAYWETKTIIDRNAIFDPNYYNEICNLRVRNKKT